jgi:predicted dehydrogenase
VLALRDGHARGDEAPARRQIGELITLESTRYLRGVAKLAKREPGWTDMEYQMRNWYYYTWLSGDFIAEQFVHELDKMAWAMRDEDPIHCVASGGRVARNDWHFILHT